MEIVAAATAVLLESPQYPQYFYIYFKCTHHHHCIHHKQRFWTAYLSCGYKKMLVLLQMLLTITPFLRLLKDIFFTADDRDDD